MVIPLGDEPSGSRTPPYVIYGLIAINTLVWLYQLQAGESFSNGWSTVPYEITHGEDLVGTRTVDVSREAFPIQLYPGPTPIYLTLLSGPEGVVPSLGASGAIAEVLGAYFGQVSPKPRAGPLRPRDHHDACAAGPRAVDRPAVLLPSEHPGQ